ncbi:DUF2782 domain-containing protein [Dokdonella sp. MW10]|uniref:DUF2782 domain-containing protein n=1 Tax=Dokdonella sp. MW10 TaxID=2992926 RepID=UPI003F8200BF
MAARLVASLLTSSLIAVHAFAAPPAKPEKSGLPPPAIDAPGVAPASAPPADASGGMPAVASTADDGVQPVMPDTRLVRDKASRDARTQQASAIRASADSVTTRQEGTDTVEEYREKGKLRMIRIIPRTGPEQMYMDNNGDGRLVRDPLDGPVSPVYFTLYEWN